MDLEPIYNVVNSIDQNSDQIIKIKTPYQNVIQFFIPDSTSVKHAKLYFPSNKLMVNRLPQDFVNDHYKILSNFWQLIDHQAPAFKNVWATTAHLKSKHAFLVELSYE